MKILFVVHNTTRKGGAYFRGQGFAKPLARLGHDVTLMSISMKERFKTVEKDIENFHLVESPDLLWGIGRTGWDPWDTMKRVAWLKHQRFDIVHTVDTRPAVCLPAMYARSACGAKWIADWTDWWGRGGATSERPGWAVRTVIGPLEQFFEEWPRPKADGTVVISRALGARAERLGIRPETILYLPPGADPDAIRETSIDDARTRLKLPADLRLIGYLGNIYQRDADLLFDALLAMNDRAAKLVLIGGAKVVVKPAAADRVISTGHVPFDQMLDYLSACNLLALPLSNTVANRGRWPSKLNEYVAVGRPTVACAVGDVSELFGQYPIGLVAKPEVQAFASKLDQVLADPAGADRMGAAARDLARTVYSQAEAGHKLEAFYSQILTGAAETAGTPGKR